MARLGAAARLDKCFTDQPSIDKKWTLSLRTIHHPGYTTQGRFVGTATSVGGSSKTTIVKIRPADPSAPAALDTGLDTACVPATEREEGVAKDRSSCQPGLCARRVASMRSSQFATSSMRPKAKSYRNPIWYLDSSHLDGVLGLVAHLVDEVHGRAGCGFLRIR